MSATVILAVLAGLVVVGMALEELFRRTGVPDVLVLLLLGLVASMSGVFDVADLKGIDRTFTTAALVLILFEGASRLRVQELREALAPSTILTFANFLATMAVMGVLGWALIGMRPLAALCLGAILGGTSSAVVIPMVALLPLQPKTRTVLTLESAVSDVLCIVVTLALTGVLVAGELQPKIIAFDLAWSFVGAVVIGGAAAGGWAFGLRALRARRASLLAMGAAVFLVFAAAEAVGTFGAIAVLAFGIVLGNVDTFAANKPYARELALTEGERTFLSESAFFLKVLFFVYLGAALKLDGYQPFVFGGLATVAMFLLRPLVVRLSLRASTTTSADAKIAAAMVPKGLAAAVLAAVPSQAGVVEGATIEATVFGCVLFTITLAALLTLFRERPFVERALGRLFRGYLAAPASEAAAAPPRSETAAPPASEAATTPVGPSTPA